MIDSHFQLFKCFVESLLDFYVNNINGVSGIFSSMAIRFYFPV